MGNEGHLVVRRLSTVTDRDIWEGGMEVAFFASSNFGIEH